VLALGLLCSPSSVLARTVVPSFLHAEAGKSAYIDDDEEGGDYLCSRSTYIFDLTLDIKTCPRIADGTLIQILTVLRASGTDHLRHAAIRIRTVNRPHRTGWIDALSLQPILPIGTLLRIRDSVSLVSGEHMNNSLMTTPTDGIFKVPDNTLVRLLKQVAPNPNSGNYVVEVVGGPHAGKHAWLPGMDTQLEGLDLWGVVNCGGFGGEIATPMDTDIAVFDKVMRINARGALLVIKYASQSMIRLGKGGSIVNVSSQAALVGLPGHISYGSSKAALDNITRVAALELGKYNIRVNSVNPTAIMTPMSASYWSRPEVQGPFLKQMPLGRWATEDEIAAPIVFLLGDGAAMISGVSLPIDGGFTSC